MIDPVFLTAARVNTFDNERALTNASGFFFERDEHLYLVTSRHVMADEPSKHYPNRIEIELHTDADNLAQSTGFSIPLYRDGLSVWRQGKDAAGDVDVAVIEIDRTALPEEAEFRAFSPAHLLPTSASVVAGASLVVIGFPLGFHDTLHHLPVVRHAVIASPYGLRFQGHGYFLTDARTHRGTSGAPVLMRIDASDRDSASDASLVDLPWRLLGIHSARLDVGTRDLQVDEALGLNCAWYSDVILTLTESAPSVSANTEPSEPPKHGKA